MKTRTLGMIIEGIETGVSINAEDVPANVDEPGILKLDAIAGDHLLLDRNKRIPDEKVQGLQVSLRKGSLLVTRSNSVELVGACVYVPEDCPTRYLPDLIWQVTLRRNAGVLPQWLQLFLASPLGRKEIARRASGTSGSMKKLSMGTFRQIPFPYVPEDFQSSTVKLLRHWTIAVRKIQQELSALRYQKAGLMQDLLTGRRRFPEFQEPWKEHRLGGLFDERSEVGFENLPLLSVTADRGLIPRNEVNRKDTSNADKSKYKRVCNGDIVYNTMRMWQGVSALSQYEGIVSPAYTVAVPKKQISALYVAYLFKLPFLVHRFWRYSQGLVDDTLNLKFPHFSQVHVEIPQTLDEQNRIAAVLAAADEEIKLLEDLSDAIERQKRGLMQRLLTGEMTVPESLIEKLHAEAVTDEALQQTGESS